MPQNPNNTYAENPSGALVALQVDADGALDIAGAVSTPSTATARALNLGAAAAISTTATRLCRVIIIAPGSGSGAFTLNDCDTTGAATAANTVWTMAHNSTANVGGAVFDLDVPLTTGLTLSAVPGAGTPLIAVTYA